MPAPGGRDAGGARGVGRGLGRQVLPLGGGAPRLSSRLPRGPDRDAGRRGRGSPLCPRPRTPGHDRLPPTSSSTVTTDPPTPASPANPEPTARTWGTPSPATRSRTRCGRPSAGRPRGPRRSAGGHRAPRPAARRAARTAPGREDAAGGPGRPRRPAFLPPINQHPPPPQGRQAWAPDGATWAGCWASDPPPTSAQCPPNSQRKQDLATVDTCDPNPPPPVGTRLWGLSGLSRAPPHLLAARALQEGGGASEGDRQVKARPGPQNLATALGARSWPSRGQLAQGGSRAAEGPDHHPGRLCRLPEPRHPDES